MPSVPFQKRSEPLLDGKTGLWHYHGVIHRNVRDVLEPDQSQNGRTDNWGGSPGRESEHG